MTESKQSTRMAYYAIEAYYVRKYNYLIISKMDIYKLSSKSTSNIVHRFFFYYLKISVWGFRESKMFLSCYITIMIYVWRNEEDFI